MIAYGDRTICSRGQSEFEAPIDKMLQEYNNPRAPHPMISDVHSVVNPRCLLVGSLAHRELGGCSVAPEHLESQSSLNTVYYSNESKPHGQKKKKA